MGKSLIWPYEVADPKHFSIGKWERSVNKQKWSPLDEEILDWDKYASFFLRTEIDISGDLLKKSAKLPDDSVLNLVIIIDCPSTKQRIVESREVDPYFSELVELEIPPGCMRGAISVEAHVVAKSYRHEKFTGRRLLSAPPKWSFNLSENASGFPTEAFSFKSSRISDNLEWKVIVQASRELLWESAFADSIELWVNTDNAESSRALLDAGHELHKHYLSLVERDVVWTILFNLAEGASEGLGEQLPIPGSVGASMTSFIVNRLKMQVVDFLLKIQSYPLEALEDVRNSMLIKEIGKKG